MIAGGGKRARRGYLDWLRGVAVLVMIAAHVIDSWTWAADRETRAFGWSVILGGMGAPLFLFLAGAAVPLAASEALRRTADRNAASNAVARRGLAIFGLAFLFRIQAWVLGWSSPRALLKVDILNIMGPSIFVAALAWGAAKTTAGRIAGFVACTAAIVFSTPLIRIAPIGALPDPIEAYIRPVAGLANFVIFPWAAFVFAGALVGQLIDGTTGRERERRVNLWLGISGAAIAASAYCASYLPTPYPRSDFWTSSPAYFFIRAGLMTAAVGVAYAWEARPGGVTKWSPLRQLGRTSLFIYWIHVEMVYGLISVPLHRALPLPQAWLAYAAFVVLMLGCSVAKDWVVSATATDKPTQESREDGRSRRPFVF